MLMNVVQWENHIFVPLLRNYYFAEYTSSIKNFYANILQIPQPGIYVIPWKMNPADGK